LSGAITSSLGQKIASDIQKKLKSPQTISINIQINLPVTENITVYENFFKALKEIILETDQKQDKSTKKTA